MVALISAAVSVTDCLTGDAVGQRLVHSCDLLVRICDGGFCLLNAFVCLSQTRIESLIDRGDLIRDGFIHGGDLPVNISSDAFADASISG